MLNTRVLVKRYGGAEVLEVVKEPLRKPQKDEILVKVQSSGVALADVMRREGKYPLSPTPPFTPGYDAVGIVQEVGHSVEQFSKGDRVAVFFSTGTGGYASHVYARIEETIAIPENIDAGSAVAVILNYVSAFQMLHRIANVSEGERILIHGASGGVGTALLELGRLAKLEMYGTASHAKHNVVSQFGAMAIDYKTEDFVDVIHNHVPEGMDVVFDPIGGKNYERSLETLSKNGQFIGYGYTSILKEGDTEDWSNDWAKLAGLDTTEKGNPVHMFSITTLKEEKLEWFQEDLSFLFSLLEAGEINPLISHRLPMRDAAFAQQLLEKSLGVGKVVLIH